VSIKEHESHYNRFILQIKPADKQGRWIRINN